MKSKKSFCRGILCEQSERKNKCVDCGVYICGHCTRKFKNKNYCPDCFLALHFDEFINDVKQLENYNVYLDKNNILHCDLIKEDNNINQEIPSKTEKKEMKDSINKVLQI